MTGQSFGFKNYCFNYGELGHQASKCSKVESLSENNFLIEKLTNMDPKYDDDSGSDGDIFHGDGVTTLVIKNIILMFKGDSEKNQRRITIFHSICITKDKVCNLFIISGSFENVMSVKAINEASTEN